jgi:hypothetical protein
MRPCSQHGQQIVVSMQPAIGLGRVRSRLALLTQETPWLPSPTQRRVSPEGFAGSELCGIGALPKSGQRIPECGDAALSRCISTRGDNNTLSIPQWFARYCAMPSLGGAMIRVCAQTWGELYTGIFIIDIDGWSITSSSLCRNTIRSICSRFVSSGPMLL